MTFYGIKCFITVLEVLAKIVRTNSSTEGKANASYNVGNKLECTRTEEGLPVASQFLLQSVVKPCCKTGLSKEAGYI